MKVFDVSNEEVIIDNIYIELPFDTDKLFNQEQVFITNDTAITDVLINGYIRDHYNHDKVPKDLFNLMMKFYHYEWLHIFKFTGDHFRVNLNKILNF